VSPIIAPDVVLNAGNPLPVGWVVSPNRPTLIIETNGRACSLSILGGSVEARQGDGFGQVFGAETALTPSATLALGASARWRISYDGSSGEASPLVFS
jgi:hypothetical protein